MKKTRRQARWSGSYLRAASAALVLVGCSILYLESEPANESASPVEPSVITSSARYEAPDPLRVPTSEVESAESRPRPDSLSQLLAYHQTGILGPGESAAIYALIRDLSASADGREDIVRLYLDSSRPQQADALHRLILDADLKDSVLIRLLISRHQHEPEGAAFPRLLELISDLNTLESEPYQAEIDRFLAAAVLNPDPGIRELAAAQLLWYKAHHSHSATQPAEALLLDLSPQVRNEVYDFLAQRNAERGLSDWEANQMKQSLSSLLHAHHLQIDSTERQRIQNIISELGRR